MVLRNIHNFICLFAFLYCTSISYCKASAFCPMLNKRIIIIIGQMCTLADCFAHLLHWLLQFLSVRLLKAYSGILSSALLVSPLFIPWTTVSIRPAEPRAQTPPSRPHHDLQYLVYLFIFLTTSWQMIIKASTYLQHAIKTNIVNSIITKCLLPGATKGRTLTITSFLINKRTHRFADGTKVVTITNLVQGAWRRVAVVC